MSKNKLFILLFFICCIQNSINAQGISSFDLFFETDSFKLSSDRLIKLQDNLKKLDTVIVSGISIYGYCDDIGSKNYNKSLSYKRANYIKDLLLTKNINETLINQTTGKGELVLSKGNNIIEQRAFNRRAEIHIHYNLKEKELIAVTPKPIDKKESKLSDDQKIGDKITLENILFYGGRHVLLPESYDDLEILNSTLLEKKKYHIMILGHICCVHDGEDGEDFDTGQKNLSVARAKMIYEYLIKNGVSAERLSYKGMKADYPIGLGDKFDRRVEIEITKIVSE